MRIDAYNQIAQLYDVQKSVVKAPQMQGNASMGRDRLSISQAGRDYQVAKNAVSEASDIREDKVTEMKKRIQAGTYSVDPAAFADKLLAKYSINLM